MTIEGFPTISLSNPSYVGTFKFMNVWIACYMMYEYIDLKFRIVCYMMYEYTDLKFTYLSCRLANKILKLSTMACWVSEIKVL